MDKQEELNKVEGKLDARSVEQMGIMIGRDWFNFDSKNSSVDKEDMRGVLAGLKKGDKIRMTMSDEKHYKDVEVIERAPEQKGFNEGMSFKELLKKAHENKRFKGLVTEVLHYDVENKFALVKASVYIDIKGQTYKFEAHGDADKDNITNAKVALHYIRMAETRAISRALRFALGEAETAKEEMEEAELEEESDDKPKPYHG